MHTHSFTYRGLTANIEIDGALLHLYYQLPDGNFRHFNRIKFFEEDLLQEWVCIWATWLTNSIGEEFENSRKTVQYRVAKSEVEMYQQFIMANTPNGVSYMDFYKRSSMNGLIEGLKDFGCTNVNDGELLTADKNARNGVIAYDPFAFTPVQPVSFTEVVTHESSLDANDGIVDITIIDGSGSYTYSLDGADPIALNQITGLSVGDHTIKVIGDDGGESVIKKITINSYSE